MRDHHCVHRNPALTGSDAESVGLWGIHSPKITEFYSWPRPQSLRENELVPSKSKKPILFPTDLWKAKQVEVYHHLFSLGSSANHLTTLYPSFVLTGVQNGNALWWLKTQFKWKVFLAIDDQISNLWITCNVFRFSHTWKTGFSIFFLLEFNSLGWGQPVLQPTQNSTSGWTGEKTSLRWDHREWDIA